MYYRYNIIIPVVVVLLLVHTYNILIIYTTYCSTCTRQEGGQNKASRGERKTLEGYRGASDREESVCIVVSPLCRAS